MQNLCTQLTAYTCTVTTTNPDRAAHFPAIEKKYGKPMSHWHRVMSSISTWKYADQMTHLMEMHGFTRTHANALVMYSKGSTTSRRHESPEAYFSSLDGTTATTMRKIFSTLQKAFPELDVVIAWNQPMLKFEKKYVFGASAATHHILIAPWNAAVLEALRPRLSGYEVNKKTIRVPVDWDVDAGLLRDMVAPQLS